MKNNKYIIGICSVALMFFTSCTVKETTFFEDEQNNGLSIFSNTGYNIMSCYINQKPWRTIDRTISGAITPIRRYELSFTKDTTNATSDTLRIVWEGVYLSNYPPTSTPYNTSSISLAIVMPKNIPLEALGSYFQGKRLSLDGTNGYIRFSDVPGNGAGNILFQTFEIKKDNVSYSGKISGLYDVSIGATTITKGRFDHLLDNHIIYY